jgi:VWFA-related protein
MFFSQLSKITAGFILLSILTILTFSQSDDKKQKSQSKVRTMTIPVSIFAKEELKQNQAGEYIEAGEIMVKENDDQQTILSIRSVTNTPLHIAVLIQDNLSSNVNLQLDDIRSFVRKLPPDSRVLVAYLRSGSTQIVQKFTTDLEKAAGSIRAVVGSPSIAPNSPYEGVEEVLARFDALPTGRRAILLVSDGLDINNPSPTQSLRLEQAILKAQRRSVAVYSFYSSATLTENGNSTIILNAQGALNRLSEETGGRAFFQGTIAPISFQPFFRDLNSALNRQFALTYLSTHPKKGYYKVQVFSTNPEIRIEHPKGYYYRGSN